MTTDIDLRPGYLGAIDIQTLDGLSLPGLKLADKRRSYGSYYGIEWTAGKVKYYGADINAVDKTVLGVIYKNKGETPLV